MAGSDNIITAQDHARITAAIRDVETRTSGEVFAVVAHASDGYFYVSGFFAALWVMVGGAMLAFAAWWFDVGLGAFTIPAAQGLALAALLVTLAVFPALRLLLVPRSVAYRRASANAVRQFLAHGIHTTTERSGVLLFVSLAEHYAEVVADEGINEKVQQDQWNTMVATLTEAARDGRVCDGFITAIAQAGDLLATHFPPRPGERNELDDRLVEL